MVVILFVHHSFKGEKGKGEKAFKGEKMTFKGERVKK